jgi:hypothetical protein
MTGAVGVWFRVNEESLRGHNVDMRLHLAYREMNDGQYDERHACCRSLTLET